MLAIRQGRISLPPIDGESAALVRIIKKKHVPSLMAYTVHIMSTYAKE